MSTSASGNPLGPTVEPLTAQLPRKTTIKGRLVTLEPRHLSHFKDLYDVLGGPEHAHLWDYVPNGPFLSRDEFDTALLSRLELPGSAIFTIMSNSSQKAVGSVALIDIVPEHRCIQVGYVLFSKLLQRTREATEVIYLLTALVFERLGYRRFEWKCDNLNEPSKRAALRYGFKFEGVFRQHLIVKGRNRDTAWFSMIDTEWPVVKRGFEAWLDEGNFDEIGRQRMGLVQLRDAAEVS